MMMTTQGGSVIRWNPSTTSSSTYATTSTPAQASESSFNLSGIPEASDITPFSDSFIERLASADSNKDQPPSDDNNNRNKDNECARDSVCSRDSCQCSRDNLIFSVLLIMFYRGYCTK